MTEGELKSGEELKRRVRSFIYGFKDSFSIEDLCKVCEERGKILLPDVQADSLIEDIAKNEPPGYIEKHEMSDGMVEFTTFFARKCGGGLRYYK